MNRRWQWFRLVVYSAWVVFVPPIVFHIILKDEKTDGGMKALILVLWIFIMADGIGTIRDTWTLLYPPEKR